MIIMMNDDYAEMILIVEGTICGDCCTFIIPSTKMMCDCGRLAYQSA